MKSQPTLADIESAARRRATKRDGLLRQMDEGAPWTALVKLTTLCCREGGRERSSRKRLRENVFLRQIDLESNV